jgi:hypothetical protein
MQVSTNGGGTLELAERARLNPDVSFTYRHFQAVSNELVVAKVLLCPTERRRVAVADFASLQNENISYWINPGAAFGNVESPLAGDRNIRTSGRTEWTFVQFAPNDALEFSAELHGYRGNVLFGDAHVDALSSRDLRAVFVSSNGADIVLTLPQGSDGSGASSASASANSSASTGNNGANSGVGSANNSASRSSDSPSGAATSNTSSTANSANAGNPNSTPRQSQRSRAATENAGSSEPMIVARLDGTFVTSAVPRQATNSVAEKSRIPSEVNEGNPIVEFVAWLTHTAARGTYWLIFLLLLALIAFEIARRRAKRKRGEDVEVPDQ